MARFLPLGVVCLLAPALAQTPPAAQRAYDALRARDYDVAIPLFREAIDATPSNLALRKDLAYTYLKAGETEAARDQFSEILRNEPNDDHIALEYAFLSFETKQPAQARRTFQRLRASASAEVRAAAERAFANIDRPLAEGIARWSAVVAKTPKDFSAQQELAQLLEQRDEFAPAVEHYLAAWRIRPEERDLLLDAGRVWQALGQTDQAAAALLAASCASRPRVAEQARELLAGHTPAPVEFLRALELDPANVELRREFVRLLLARGEKPDAERELRILADQNPLDLNAAYQLGSLLLERHDREGALAAFERILKSDDEDMIERVRALLRMPPRARRKPATAARRDDDAAPAQEIGPKEMGERSFRAGYLKDAARYFESAHEADPLDFSVMLRLGWTYNALHQDQRALSWFNLARRSPDAAVAGEARHASAGLRPQFARWTSTTWTYPFYSTRWHDLFSYAQTKAEFRVGDLPVRPYVSLRFIGDTRGALGADNGATAVPQYLSESSFLVALGLATRMWHGAMAWGEAGSAIRYTGSHDRGFMVPDYRGGVSFTRGKGHLLGASKPGWFAETHDDGVFVSRFGNDFLLYLQNQGGYTPAPRGGLRAQVYWNANLTTDVQGQPWANFLELGPGFRFRWSALPEGLVFSVNLLRGSYLRDGGKPFHDVRAGFWYALTR